MQNFYFIAFLLRLLASVIGCTYGSIISYQQRRGTYFMLVLAGSLTLCFGRINTFLAYYAGIQPSGFMLGELGIVGALLFYLTANKNHLSMLEDTELPKHFWQKLLPWLMPLLLILIYFMILRFHQTPQQLIVPTLFLLAALPCGYSSMKYAVAPDIDKGFISCMRSFNIVLCLHIVDIFATEGFRMQSGEENLSLLFLITLIVDCLCTLLILPIMERGQQRWFK